MPTFRYHLSSQPTERPPETADLPLIEATSPADLAQRLIRSGVVSPGSHLGWVHVLVWHSQDGKSRGFETLSFSDIADIQPKAP